ncbi:serine hydroxymethyltransferase [Candidatus Micrarchaeota archaeon]|nr:serine hydroxymethyltransferase [Candidatus Micrarchaeota archaeon]
MATQRELIHSGMSRRLRDVDPEAAAMVRTYRDEVRGERLNLIASNCLPSLAVRDCEAQGLGNIYSEGYGNSRYYHVELVLRTMEALAIQRGKEVLGMPYLNVQLHDGCGANEAVYMALKMGTEDVLFSSKLAHGGHLSHGAEFNVSGKTWAVRSYGVELGTGEYDYDQIRERARHVRDEFTGKRMVIMTGASAYPFRIDFEAFGSIARELDAVVVADISHYLGIILGGAYPSPAAHVDAITSTTHKAGGPKGAIVGSREELGKVINSAVFPGLQGGPNIGAMLAKAVLFHEATQPWFKEWAEGTVRNARALAEVLAAEGIKVWGREPFTESHLFLVETRESLGLKGRDAQEALARAGITINMNTLPGDETQPKGTNSGLRFGTPWLTRLGMGVEEMLVIGKNFIAPMLRDPHNQDLAARIAGEAKELRSQFPAYEQGAEPDF